MPYDNLQSIWNEMENEKLPGGLGEKKHVEDLLKKYNDASVLDILQALVSGVQVEMEHTDDDRIAFEIAFDHILEDLQYYEKLKTIESVEFEYMKDEEAFAHLMQAKVDSETISQAEELSDMLRRKADSASSLGMARKYFNKVEKLSDKFGI
jgi:hypothetical protein